MTTMQEFKSYQKEIGALINELKGCDDLEYSKKTINNINGLVELIEMLIADSLSAKELDEIASYVAYVNDTIANFETNFTKDLEPDL